MKVLMDKPAPVISSATTSKKETDDGSFLNFLTSNLMPNSAEATEVSAEEVEGDIELLEESNQSEQEMASFDQLFTGIQQNVLNERNANPVANQIIEETEKEVTTEAAQQALVNDALPLQKEKRSTLMSSTSVTSPTQENTKINVQDPVLVTPEQRSLVNIEQNKKHIEEVITAYNPDSSNAKDNVLMDAARKLTIANQKLTSTPTENQLNKTISPEMMLQNSIQSNALSLDNKAMQYEANQLDIDLTAFNLNGAPSANHADSLANKLSMPANATPVTPPPANVSIRIDFIEQLRGKSASQGVHHINIHITPPDLGPITAKLRIDNNKVDLEIMAKNSDVVNIIKSQLSALREQFDDADIHLNSVNVQNSDQFQQRDNEKSPLEQAAADQNNGQLSSNALKQKEKIKKVSDALIDTYI